MIAPSKDWVDIDSFAGAGGASLGFAWATGRSPDIGINHDEVALAVHEMNHPDTLHVRDDVRRVDIRELVGDRYVRSAWFSPDCTHHSRARGSKPVQKNIRGLAWIVIQWCEQLGGRRPLMIFLENVAEFAEYGPVVPLWQCAECEWRGTEGQAILCRVRRRCPQCNSLRLRMTEEQVPDPKKKGITFKRWCGRLRSLGYTLQYKILDAANYGAKTRRKRLFLVARRDGVPIQWPEHSHVDPKKLSEQPLFNILKPWRTAAECIDWSIPCRSIFGRERELAEKTQHRIAMAIKRYVLENPQPYIIGVGGRAGQSPPTPVGAPVGTITAKNDRAVVSPVLVPLTHAGDRRAHPLTEALPTITGAHRGELALIAPGLVRFNGDPRRGDVRCQSLNDPASTIDTQNRFGLVAAMLAKHYGGVVGQKLDQPIGAITAVDHHSLVTASLVQLNQHCDGRPMNQPVPTVTGSGNHHGLVAASLVRMNHGDKSWNSVDEPAPTITTQSNKLALIYAFLIRYFGTSIGQHLTEPLYTITGKDRFGLVLVKVDGEYWCIADILMRMLVPRELARAQGFPDTYILERARVGGRMVEISKTKQTAMVGNSVSPYPAEAIIRANLCVEAANA